MILDALTNISCYAGLNPHFPKVVEFLEHNDLSTLPLGRHTIDGDDVFVNIVDTPAKERAAAKIETHDQMIDIQIPISDTEEQGYTPRTVLPEAPYCEADDISFYEGEAQHYYTINPGEFVIYFPWDGHAPAITPTGLRKAIFKIKSI